MSARRSILLVLAGLAAATPRPVHAQAGMEAGAAAGQAADWAKRQRQREGTTPSGPTGRVVPGARSTKAVLAPERSVRKKSGAPGTVTGKVVDRNTQRPVPGVILRLVSTEPQYVVETKLYRTDSTGAYRFTEVEPGTWKLTVDSEQMPATYAVAETARLVKVARRGAVAMPPFTLYRTACVAGHVEWADGYVFSAAPVLVAPRNPALPVVKGKVNGVGDYEICSAPADTAMVWIELRDGRRIGRPTALAVGKNARLDFKPDPVESMPGTTLFLELKTASGDRVPFGRVVLVGRKYGVAGEPNVVFVRDGTANREGELLGYVPFGTYEFLAWNPRQGEWGRVEQFVIARGAGEEVHHDIVLRGASTSEDQTSWRQDLLDRATDFQRRWVP